jgi:hypothetical protein
MNKDSDRLITVTMPEKRWYWLMKFMNTARQFVGPSGYSQESIDLLENQLPQ